MKFWSSFDRHVWLAIAAVLAAILAVALAILPSSRTPTATPPLQFPLINTSPGFARGLYSGAILDSEGGLDVVRTLNRVVQANANTYFYLVWDRLPRASALPPTPSVTWSLDAWRKLPTFATEAAKRGIRIVVYLVPPTESQARTYLPYGWNYLAWFSAIGRLAATHHNIIGIAMDDLGSNLPSFLDSQIPPSKPRLTISDLAADRANARRFAPWIEFLPVMYARDLLKSRTELADVRAVADGVIYPFAGLESLNGGQFNSVDPRGLLTSVAEIRARTSCGGAATCWQLSLAGGGTATASTVLRGWAPGSTLQFSLTSVPAASTAGHYRVRVTLDGGVIASTVAPGGQVRLELPSVGPQHHTFALSVSSTAGPAAGQLIIDSLKLVSKGHRAALMSTRAAPHWSLDGGGSGNTFTVVHALKLIVMYYCTRFGIEGTTLGAADAPYLTQLVPQLDTVARDGLADGIVAFRLNLASSRKSSYQGDTANYPIVADMYRSMLPRPTR